MVRGGREQNEKEALEHAAVKEFVAAYNTTNSGGEIELVQFGDAPDATARIADQKFGIEVGHLFGTAFDARNTLGRDGDIRSMERGGSEWGAHVSNAMIAIPDRILPALNCLLEDKASKYYSDWCWLLIRNGAFMLWGKPDFEEHRSLIRVPNQHGFVQIWLLCGRDTSDGLLQLARWRPSSDLGTLNPVGRRAHIASPPAVG